MKKILIIIISALCVCTSAWAEEKGLRKAYTKDSTGYEELERVDGHLPDGRYEIASIGSTDNWKSKTDPATLFLDYDRSGGEKNNHMLLKTRSNNAYQQFEVKKVNTVGSHHFYTIKNVATGKYVDLYGGEMNNGAKVGLYDGTGGTSNVNQMWEICASEDGTFFIKSSKVREQSYYDADKGVYYYQMWQSRLVPTVVANDGVGYWSNTENADVTTTVNFKEHSWAFIPVKGQKQSAIINGGSYHLVPKYNPTPDAGFKHITLNGTSDANGTKFVAVNFAENIAQRFTITYNESGTCAGYYTLQTVHANRYAYTVSNKMMNDIDVHQWEGLGENACWAIVPSDEAGYYYIINRSGRVLESYSSVITHRPNSTDAQKFRLVKEDNVDGVYTIRLAKADKQNLGLNLDGGVANGTNINLLDQVDLKRSQMWTVSNNNDGVHTIATHLSSSYCLDVAGGTAADGTNIQLYTFNGSDAQKWHFCQVGTTSDGKAVYWIINHLGYCLDDSGGALNSGDNIHTWHSLNNDAQRWILEPCYISKTVTDAQYATMCYADFNLKVPEGLEALIFTLNSDGTDAVQAKTYETNYRIPKTEAVVLHYIPETIPAGETKTFQLQIMPDTSEPVTTGNCLRSTETDQEITAAANEYIYRLTKGPKGIGFYMTAPASEGQTPGKYLNNAAHLCYLIADFNAATVNSVPNCVILDEE